MTIFKLENTSADKFAAEPELAMGLQLGIVSGKPYVILYGKIAIQVDADVGPKPLYQQVSELLTHDETFDQLPDRLETWRANLGAITATPANTRELQTITAPQIDALVAFTMPTSPYVPPPPPAPSYIYGHLPFKGKTTNGDKFLRFEPWPTSIRVFASTVTAGTFAGPVSERPLVPNGFAAVGRYALPSLLPACTVWEISPPPGTDLEAGASVPVFGQAGGGAEVCFTKGTTAATIPPPTFISVL